MLLSFQELLASDFFLKSDENIGSRNEATAEWCCCTKREDPVHLLYTISIEISLDKRWVSQASGFHPAGLELG